MADDTTIPDEALVARARAAPRDDTRAFEMLIERHQHGVAANCRYLSGSEADAQDLTQEVLVKAYVALHRFEERARFRTWLDRIKVNHCLNWLRARKQRSYVDLDTAETGGERALAVTPRAEARTDAIDDRRRVAAVLDAIPDTLRVPLVMRELDGFSYQEIADELGIGLSAVKMRIRRGREEFRKQYDELED